MQGDALAVAAAVVGRLVAVARPQRLHPDVQSRLAKSADSPGCRLICLRCDPSLVVSCASIGPGVGAQFVRSSNLKPEKKS